MSLTQVARRRSRELLVALVAGASLTAAVVTPADASAPAGSLATVILETGDATGNPANAITTGWWGHEGGANGTGTGSTFLSLDASDGNGNVTADSQAALLAALGTDSLSNVAYAIVPTTADGSNERPSLAAGTNALDAFDAGGQGKVIVSNGTGDAAGFGASLNGSTAANDSVTTVTNKTQYTAWIDAGEPLQNYSSSLVLSDVSNGDTTHPMGTSILKAWPTPGTALSLVAFVTNGTDATLHNKIPMVAVGADGKAKSAWMPFTTVAKPGDALRTSAGYQVVGPYAPTLALTSSATGSTGTLTATVKNKSNAVATDATGTVEFAPVVGGTPGTAVPVPVSNGVATLSISSFAPGSTKTYDVRYVPDAPAQASYLTTDYVRRTVVNPFATTTALSVTGGATDTIVATVTPGAPGKLTVKDGATTLVSGTVSASVRTVKVVRALAAGRHALTATFTPGNVLYKASSAAKVVFQSKVATTLKPARPARGTRPKLVVKVAAPGAVVTGRVTIVFDPPKGLTKRITVTLRSGGATVLLPKVVRGLTRVTVLYSGNVLASSRAFSFRVS